MALKVREILNEYEIEEILTEYFSAFDKIANAHSWLQSWVSEQILENK